MEKEIKASYETIPSPNGNGYIRGYFVRPFSQDTRAATPTKLPAVLVIHENRGLNPHTEDVARRFALRRDTVSPRICQLSSSELASRLHTSGGTMPKKPNMKSHADSDDAGDEISYGALKEDLLEYAKRSRPLASLEKKQRMQLLKLLGVDANEAAKAREEDYQAAIASAKQRLQRQLAEREKNRRKDPSLMKQIETVMGLRRR